MDGRGFVAVHVGAGYHSQANGELYKEVCRKACHQAVEALRQNRGAVEAVTLATMALETSPWTNAGTGSNLTINGQVECDASIMDGNSLHYGAVGAASGVLNPIQVAESLLKTQLKGAMSLGRIPPSTLAGPGVKEWAKKHNITTCKQEEMLTDASKRAYVKNKRKLDVLEGEKDFRKSMKLEHANSRGDATSDCVADEQKQKCALVELVPQKNKQTHKSSEKVLNEIYTDGAVDEDWSELLDTVGAICVDSEGSVASTVSSGGIVLKQPGRLGQAALYGCGCWAENDSVKKGIGVSTSGCGEHLSKTLIARECAQHISNYEDPIMGIADAFKNKFLESHFLTNIDQKLGGALAVKSQVSDDQLDVEVLWIHTTDSMCLAFMSTQDEEPKALISRLPEGKQCGKSFLVQSKQMTVQELNISN